MKTVLPFTRRVLGAKEVILTGAPLAFRHAVLAALRHHLITDIAVLSVVQGAAAMPRPPSVRDAAAASVLIEECTWPHVFEIAESGFGAVSEGPFGDQQGSAFQRAINVACHTNGLGWLMDDGQFRLNGSVAEETALDDAIGSLTSAGKATTVNELKAARDDLSRIPEPDITGAIQHGGAALECLARNITDSNATFGDLVKKHPQLFPGAYRKVADGVWGVVSNKGRHLEEGGDPTLEDAFLLVGLIAALTGYLTRRAGF